jgi:ABC-type Fe3+ transport system permease subunit
MFRFPSRALLLGVLSLPLMIPAFLWAIGLSMLRTSAGWGDGVPFSGWSGCIWVQGLSCAGLAMWAAVLSLRGVSRSQAWAAMLAGGNAALWRTSLRSAFPAALAAAMAGGMLALGDSGPGLVLGWRTAAGEILTAFSARYDYQEALLWCLWLALAAGLVFVPWAVRSTTALVAAVTARDSGESWERPPLHSLWPGMGSTVVMIPVLLPLSGLLLPLLQNQPWARAWEELLRTGWNTLIYAGGAGFLAVMAAWPLAILASRNLTGKRLLTVLLVVALAVPAILPALLWMQGTGAAPPWLDWLTRSRGAVCLVLALRFLPVTCLLALRRWTALPPSWRMAAQVHGVPWPEYAWRVLWPHQWPGILLAAALTALLSAGEIGILLLLHPPGESSLPLAIFTIMANAPESLAAALCVVYLLAALPPVLLILLLNHRR